MSKELAKAYEPREVEDRIYDFWLQGGYFHAEVDPEKKPYTIVIPPPNITGQLHMGHALDETIQDILIRFKRMQGYSALWLPGTDHASIATEAKIVEAMKKEGLTKEDVGREGFLERAWDWKAKFGGRIVEQLKKLGSSCDWERERFTLDEGCSEAVKEVFVRLYEKGLIYRGERIINWCPHCKTSISDAEVEFDEHDGNFWHLRYPLTDGTGELRLATTRPETLLGDTAVAVHPDDERYKAYVGKTVTLPLVGPPDSRLVLRGLRRNHRGKGNAGEVSQVRRQPSPSGRGYPGYLVLLCLVAFLYPRLAGKDPGAFLFLSDRHPGDRL